MNEYIKVISKEELANAAIVCIVTDMTEEQCEYTFNALKQAGAPKDCLLIELPTNSSLSTLSEEEMNKHGWYKIGDGA